jgi:transposase
MQALRNEIAALKKLVAELLAENAALKAEIALLKDKLNKTSRNYSKPPSSDIVKLITNPTFLLK